MFMTLFLRINESNSEYASDEKYEEASQVKISRKRAERYVVEHGIDFSAFLACKEKDHPGK
jgi:hypothetical protein